MKPWIKTFGVIIVMIVVITYLSIDWVIKVGIETFATQANGAKVELNSAELNFWPSRLQLHGLQVTNPAEPMSNLLEAVTVNTELDALKLIRKQLIIHSATVHGLTFNTARKISGDTGHKASTKNALNIMGFDLGGAISGSGLNLPDVDQLAAEEKQHLKQEIDKIENRLKNIEQRWQDNIAQLPNDNKLDSYKARWKIAKKGNFLEKITTINAIKDDIDKELKHLRSLEKQLKNDKLLVQQELTHAQSLPQQEARRLMSKVGFSDNDIDFISALTSEQVKHYLQQGLTLFTQLSQSFSQTGPADNNLAITTKNDDAVPQLLIEQLTLDGDIDIAGSSIRFEGEGSHFAYPPENWEKPAKLHITGHGNMDETLTINASFDHRLPTFKDRLDIKASSLALSELILADKPELSMTLQQALANLSGFVAFSNNSIDLDFKGLFEQVKMQVATDDSSSTYTLISDVLSAVENFDLQLQANGNSQSPLVRLRSNLDSALKKGLGKQLEAKTAKLQQQLQQKLREQLSDELIKLEAQANFLDKLQLLLNDKQLQLKQLKIK